MPKLIKIPAHIPILNTLTGQTDQAFSFQNYLELAIFNNVQFDNPPGWRLTAKLAASAGLQAPGSDWVIDSSDWEKVKQADDSPSYIIFDGQGQKVQQPGIRGCPPAVSRQLLPFSDAIQNAVDYTPPTEKKAE